MKFEKAVVYLLLKYKDKIKKDDREGNKQCMQKEKNLKRSCRKMVLK